MSEIRKAPAEIIQHLTFPRMHHLFGESSHTPDDVLATVREQQAFLQRFNSSEGVVTEKIDGSNIGVSFAVDGSLHLRHRGGPCSSEDRIYKEAYRWAQSQRDVLSSILRTDAMLFIEWLEFNRGHVHYDDLPSYAIAIALFDAKEGLNGRYMSHRFLQTLLDGSGITTVHEVPLHKPLQTAADCIHGIGQSAYSTRSPMEGLVLRVDNGDYNDAIFKFVSPEFRVSIEGQEHWKKGPLQRNNINYEKQAALLG